MKFVSFSVVLFLLTQMQVSNAQDIKIEDINFIGSTKPKTVVDEARSSYTNHFSVSSSYEMEVKIRSEIPPNTSFNVRTYAIVGGRRISLGDTRVRQTSYSEEIFASYHIFPSSANYYGQCQFVVVVDADNEILERDESALSNEWKFQATIHSPGR